MGFTALDWVVIATCAGLTGFSKTGIPGTGILAVSLIALVMPARQSTGFLLPMLILADVMAILYWRRHVHWRSLGRLLPWTMLGLGIGYVCLDRVTDSQLKPIIGLIVLVLVIGAWIRERTVPEDRVPILASNATGYWPSTPATNLLYGLKEAIEMLEEEGFANVFSRHDRHAEATRRAVRAWGLEILCLVPEEYSSTLTAVMMPPGHDADRFRALVLEHFDMSLGTGLTKLAGKVFRIGHLGDFNDLTLAGTLAGVEMGLAVAGVPHRKGGVDAAMEFLAAEAAKRLGTTRAAA